MNIFLSLLLWLNGLTVIDGGQRCIENKSLMGEYIVGKKVITTCNENIKVLKQSKDTVIKHEYIHYIYEKRQIKKTILPSKLLNYLIREYLPSNEVLFVLLHENDYSNDEELEARLFAKLPLVVLFFL